MTTRYTCVASLYREYGFAAPDDAYMERGGQPMTQQPSMLGLRAEPGWDR